MAAHCSPTGYLTYRGDAVGKEHQLPLHVRHVVPRSPPPSQEGKSRGVFVKICKSADKVLSTGAATSFYSLERPCVSDLAFSSGYHLHFSREASVAMLSHCWEV